MWTKFAWRNLLRNKRRTFFTITMLVVGQTLFALFLGMSEGMYSDIINQIITQKTSHMQIQNKEWANSQKLIDAMETSQIPKGKIEKIKGVEHTAFRLENSGMVFVGNKVLGVRVHAIDFTQMDHILTYHKNLEMGKRSLKTLEVLISNDIADYFKLNLGEELSILSQDIDGSIATDNLIVSGILSQNMATNSLILMRMEDGEQLFAAENMATSFLISLKEGTSISDLKARVHQHLEGNSDLIVREWSDIESDFYKAMQADRKGDNIGRIIILIVLIMGVLNTIMMSLYERRREISMLKALGTSYTTLMRVIIYESLFLGLIGTSLGCLLSFIVNYYFATIGIKLSEKISYGGISFESMYSIVTWQVILVPAVIVFFACLFSTIIPAWKTVKNTSLTLNRG